MHYILCTARKEMALATMAVTASGQVTFRKDVLRHLGVRPGERIEWNPLPGGRAELKAAEPAGSIEDFIGLLAGKTDRPLSIEEMNEIAAKGWAGEE